MARYTCSYLVQSPIDQLKSLLEELFKSCHFETVYKAADYLMVRETPGQVSFAKLVMVETFIDVTTATAKGVQVNLVVKNEELPLQVDNHCHQLFEQIKQIIAENYEWELLTNSIK